MLSEGMSGSVSTVTVTVAKDASLKKFVMISVIVYDALVRFCANIVIGVETWC